MNHVQSLYQLASRQHQHQHMQGGQRRTDTAGRWCKRSWSSTPFQVVHLLEDNDVCLFVILPEGWKHPQIYLSVVTFLRAGNRKQ